MTTATGNGKQESDGVSDKKKDSTALKRIRHTIGNHMKTPEFQKSSVECLEYAPNEFELDAVLRSNADISEPWVRPNYSTKSLNRNFRKMHCFQMLGTAQVLGWDMLVFLRYAKRKGWIRYPAKARSPAPRAAFLFHVIHSERERKFHCEPLVEWPIERLVGT